MIGGPFCGFFDGKGKGEGKAEEKAKEFERDSTGGRARKRERLNRPSLTVIIPRMDREAEKFWPGVLLFFFFSETTDTSMTGGVSAQLK